MDFGVWPLCVCLVLMPLVMLPESFAAPKGLVLMGVCVVLGMVCWINAGAGVRPPFTWPLVLFAIISCLQAMRSLNPDYAAWMLTLQLGGLFVGFATAVLVTNQHMVMLARCVAIGGMLVSGFGILEYLGVSWAQLPSSGRPSATFGFRNIAAMHLSIALLWSCLLLFQRRRFDVLLGFLATGSMAAFLIFTRTRGAWLGVGAALCLGLILSWRVRFPDGSLLLQIYRVLHRRWWGFGWLCAIVFLAVFVPPNFQDASLSRMDETKTQVSSTVTSITRPGGDRGRLRIWQHTLDMILDHPVFGVGLDNWSAYYPRYDRGDVIGIEVAPDRPHNDWLWIWSELGSVGFVVYLILLWMIVRQFWHQLHKDQEMALPLLCVGLGALALMIHSCFSFPREQAVALLPLWVVLGLVGKSDRVVLGIWPMRLVGLVGLVVGLYGCWLNVAMIQFDRHLFFARDAQDEHRHLLEIQKAREYGIFDHRMLLMEGLGQSALGHYEEAAKTYQTYLSMQPYLPALYNNLGQVFEKTGQMDAAEKAYRDGLVHFFGYGRGVLLNNLAALYKKQGREKEAFKIYEEEESHLLAEGHHNLGLMYAERGDYDRALTMYEEALQQDPHMAVVYFSMGGVRLLQGEFERAAEQYETFLKNWTGVPDYVRDAQLRLRQMYPVLGNRYLKAGDWKKAEFVYQRLVGLGGASAEVYANLAMIYGRSGAYIPALDAGNRALSLNETFAPAHFALATLYDQMGKPDGALKHYRRFVALHQTEDPLLTRARQRIDALAR